MPSFLLLIHHQCFKKLSVIGSLSLSQLFYRLYYRNDSLWTIDRYLERRKKGHRRTAFTSVSLAPSTFYNWVFEKVKKKEKIRFGMTRIISQSCPSIDRIHSYWRGHFSRWVYLRKVTTVAGLKIQHVLNRFESFILSQFILFRYIFAFFLHHSDLLLFLFVYFFSLSPWFLFIDWFCWYDLLCFRWFVIQT